MCLCAYVPMCLCAYVPMCLFPLRAATCSRHPGKVTQKLRNLILNKEREVNLFYTYIMASGRNGTLYTGATSDLIKRAWEHKNNLILGFTARYSVHILVYYELHETYIEAARREKRFKNWSRQWKLNLIEKLNPEWSDLYEEITR